MAGTAQRWLRQPGQGRYARPERERRFLLAGEPPAGVAARLVVDHYLVGTRLRLRHVHADGQDVYKLTQKVRVREDDPSDLLITNAYLSAQEHAVLSALPHGLVRKTRSVHPVGGLDLVVDAFHGRLEGLRLAEVELADLAEPFVRPDWLGDEVTRDDRCSGGALAFASDDEVRALLSAPGTRRPPR